MCINMSAQKEAAGAAIHDDGGTWDQFKEGYRWTRQNVTVNCSALLYHQLVGHYRSLHCS